MQELLITNIGKLVSGDIRHPLLEADTIYIKDGLFAEIGGKEMTEKHPGVRILDAKGVTVAPGLIDSHCHPCAGDYTFRQKAVDFLESEIHGGCTTIISAGEPHFPGRPDDPAGAKAQAIFLSKTFRNKPPLGAKVYGGALILEKGLTEADFIEMEKEGVWLVGEIGLGTVKSPEDAAPLVAIAKRHGFKVHMHTGGTSIPGSSTVTADDVIKTKPTVASHCNGGPTAVSIQQVDRIICETDTAIEIVQCGNYKVAKYIYERVLELGKEDRVIFGNDAPSGTGFIPLGILRNVCYASLCGIVPEKALAMASGNTARTFGLNTGIIAVGKEADLICMDAPVGSVGRDALEAIEAGDIPALTHIMVEGQIIVDKSRNTPPGNHRPEFL